MGAAFLFERRKVIRMILEPLAAYPAFFIGFTLVLGLLIGSFLNVVIYRVP
jgi:leader peptidase (prepilin peptidase)/N-methyltransferase